MARGDLKGSWGTFNVQQLIFYKGKQDLPCWFLSSLWGDVQQASTEHGCEAECQVLCMKGESACEQGVQPHVAQIPAAWKELQCN